MNPRQCPKCSGELEPFAGICPHCGALTPVLTGEAKAYADAAPAAGHPTAPANAAAAPPPELKWTTPAPTAPRHSFTLGAVAGVVTVLVVLAVVMLTVQGMQLVNKSKPAARRTESKQSLHDVQLALEKYNKDQDQYPPYLIGGEARYAENVVMSSPDAAFTNIRECKRSQVSDPLLREGYLEQYPANPFIKNGLPVHSLQRRIPNLFGGGDPLRNDCEYNSGNLTLGTRFGAKCTTMGSVLADPRYQYLNSEYESDGRRLITQSITGASVEYHFWDVWSEENSIPVIGEQVMPFLAGEFFYKSAGPLAIGGGMEGMGEGPPLPTSVDYYILGVYGNTTDRGQDVLGPEPKIRIDLGARGYRMLQPWTRSTVNSMGINAPGSPYAAAKNTSSPCYPFAYGNPNGIDDAITMVLTAKWGRRRFGHFTW